MNFSYYRDNNVYVLTGITDNHWMFSVLEYTKLHYNLSIVITFLIYSISYVSVVELWYKSSTSKEGGG